MPKKLNLMMPGHPRYQPAWLQPIAGRDSRAWQYITDGGLPSRPLASKMRSWRKFGLRWRMTRSWISHYATLKPTSATPPTTLSVSAPCGKSSVDLIRQTTRHFEVLRSVFFYTTHLRYSLFKINPLLVIARALARGNLKRLLHFVRNDKL